MRKLVLGLTAAAALGLGAFEPSFGPGSTTPAFAQQPEPGQPRGACVLHATLTPSGRVNAHINCPIEIIDDILF